MARNWIKARNQISQALILGSLSDFDSGTLVLGPSETQSNPLTGVALSGSKRRVSNPLGRLANSLMLFQSDQGNRAWSLLGSASKGSNPAGKVRQLSKIISCKLIPAHSRSALRTVGLYPAASNLVQVYHLLRTVRIMIEKRRDLSQASKIVLLHCFLMQMVSNARLRLRDS